MEARTLKGGGPDPGESSDVEAMEDDNSAIESEELQTPAAKRKRSPNRTRLSSLRTERMSDSDWSQVTGSDTDTAPGQGRRGAARGRGATGRVRGAPRGVRRAARIQRGAPRGRSVAGASLMGGAGQGTVESESGDTYDTEQGKDTEEENENIPTNNIRAWEETEGETSGTHDEFVDDILEDGGSEEFSDDESDHTIQTKYVESCANQKYRRKILARKLFKSKVLKKNGFDSGEEASDEEENNNRKAPKKGRRKWKKNGQFKDLGPKRQKQKLDAIEQTFGQDTDMKIAFAKRVLKNAGIKFEEDEDAMKDKNLMLALSAQGKNKLTQKEYESLRFTNQAMFGTNWPSWLELLRARKKCWPEDITVTKEGASYSLRNVVIHTNQRYA